MPNTLRIKRGQSSSLPNGTVAEPLFTIDTYDLYIGKGDGTNQRFQKYIASGSTSQILRGDGSLYTFPLNISSPTNGQVLKYNGTSWVNDNGAGITGSGTTNYISKFISASALGNSQIIDNGTNVLVGTTTDAGFKLDINGTLRSTGSATLGASLSVTGVSTFGDIIGIGSVVTQNNLNISRAIVGATTANGIQVNGQIGGSVTAAARYYNATASTAAGTLTDLFYYRTQQGTFTGTVTNQYAFYAHSTLIGATNNYGFYGDIPSGTNMWNLYINGTALNYINGALLLGGTTDDTINKLQINGGTITNNLIVRAGTSSIAPIDFTPTSAVLKTTAAAGDLEVDSNGLFYYTHNGSSRGIVTTEQFLISNTTRTLTATTTSQNLFSGTSAGAVYFTPKANTSYFFEAYITLTGLATSNNAVGFGLSSTGTISGIDYTAISFKVNTLTTPTAAFMARITTNAITAVTATNNQTGATIYIKGIIRVGATAGIITPIISMITATAASTIATNTYVKFIPIGTDTVNEPVGSAWGIST